VRSLVDAVCVFRQEKLTLARWHEQGRVQISPNRLIFDNVCLILQLFECMQLSKKLMDIVL
jgi:hypothetical protein